MATHYLLFDEIMVIGKERSYTYKTLQDVDRLEDIWTKEVKIVGPGDHEMPGFVVKDWKLQPKAEDDRSFTGYRFPKYDGTAVLDDSIWAHLRYKSWGDEPQQVRIFRTVFELEGGELPIIMPTSVSRYAW